MRYLLLSTLFFFVGCSTYTYSVDVTCGARGMTDKTPADVKASVHDYQISGSSSPTSSNALILDRSSVDYLQGLDSKELVVPLKDATVTVFLKFSREEKPRLLKSGQVNSSSFAQIKADGGTNKDEGSLSAVIVRVEAPGHAPVEREVKQFGGEGSGREFVGSYVAILDKTGRTPPVSKPETPPAK